MDRVPDDELISAYLDDELSAEERTYVERLLVERPEARRLLEELRGVRESLQTLPSYRLEPDFGAAVLRQAEREVLRAPSNGQVIEPRRDVIESHDAVGGGSSSVAPPDGPRWRRPLAWSIVAVAAAVALMIVNRQADRERPVALHNADQDAERLRDWKEKEEFGEPAGADKRAPLDDLARLKASGSTTTVPATMPPATTAPPTAQSEVYFTKSGAIAGTPAPNDAVMLKGAAPVADQPVGGGAFNIGLNGGAIQPTAPTTAGQMSVFNSIEPGRGGAMPTPAPTGQYAVDNKLNLSKAGAGTLVINGTTQYLEAGAQSSGTLQLKMPAGQVDTTPLVAATDYQRAQSLVTELNDARRLNRNEDEAIRAFSRRTQVAQVEKSQQQQSSQAPANDQLLIVTIEVPNEAALERCLLPVLQQQQIADLTQVRARPDVTLRLGTLTGNYGPAAAEATREGDAAKQPLEEYVYVVANRKQIEATLETLNRQPETIVDLEVEPAPADPSQQAWKGYSRGYNDGEKAKFATGQSTTYSGYSGVANQPAAPAAAPAPGSAPAPTTPLIVAAPASEGLIAKKSEAETQQERKNADVAGKASDGLTANRAPAEVSQSGNSFGSGGVGMGGGAPSQAATQQQAFAQQGDSYGLGLVPLSRSQRLRGIDASGLQSVAQAAPEGRARFSVQDRQAGEKAAVEAKNAAPTAAKTAASATTASPAASSTPSAPAPALPSSAVPTTSPAITVANPTPIAGPQSASSSIAAKSKDDAAAGGNPTVVGLGQLPQTPVGGEQTLSQQTYGYELPPDFHEALFICRVAPQAAAAQKALDSDVVAPAKTAVTPAAVTPAAAAPAKPEAKPTSTQPTGPTQPTAPRGKAE